MTDHTPSKRPSSNAQEKSAFLDDFLLYLLARASTEASAGFHDVVRKRGLSVAEWRVLFTLHDGACSVGEMAARTLMQQPTLTKVLDRMEAAGTVKRKMDPADGRRVVVSLNPDGRRLTEDLMPLALAHEANLLAQFGGREAAMLKKALKHLIAHSA